jgi:hypothetical protein
MKRLIKLKKDPNDKIMLESNLELFILECIKNIKHLILGNSNREQKRAKITDRNAI